MCVILKLGAEEDVVTSKEPEIEDNLTTKPDRGDQKILTVPAVRRLAMENKVCVIFVV